MTEILKRMLDVGHLSVYLKIDLRGFIIFMEHSVALFHDTCKWDGETFWDLDLMRTLVRILKSLGLRRLLFNKEPFSFHPLYPGLQVTSGVCSPRPGHCCHMNSVGPWPTNDSSLEKVWQWFSVLFAEDQAYHWVHQGGHRVGSYQANPSGKELLKKNRLSSKSHYPNCKKGCERNEKITLPINSIF